MADLQNTNDPASGSYTVVARRYRPKSFNELVGQENISLALGKAIVSGRVGHAYLFTGARGVGKTSTARIFAKALNAPEGSTPSPDNASDICQAIDAGEDMDVIEIDGASNRGIEEIRQLRANINVRPSRSRYKIYIIDEVHMLTTQAFNALLKTLEEPPEHVKFIFCTTDADKIPITVLSRCQRFDFSPVGVPAIQKRLKEICDLEGFQAQEDALALLARRAAGSMRDSQSLLEQVFSFSSGEITVDQVHALLGTADESSMLKLVEALRSYSAIDAIQHVESTLQRGADAGQLAEQLLSYLRDLMTVAVGGGPELLKLANPTGHPHLKSLADQWGLQSILAAIQLLDEALVRMRHSIQARTLLELALVQICQLRHLTSVGALLDALNRSGHDSVKAAPVATDEKKNVRPLSNHTATEPVGSLHSAEISAEVSSKPLTNAYGSQQREEPKNSGEPKTATKNRRVDPGVNSGLSPQPQMLSHSTMATQSQSNIQRQEKSGLSQSSSIDRSNVDQVSAVSPISSATNSLALEQWKKATAHIEGMLANFAAIAHAVETFGSDKWCIVFPPGSQKSVEYCEVPQRKQALVEAIHTLLGRAIQISFRVEVGEIPRPVEVAPSSSVARSKRMRQVAEHPLIDKICKLLDGEILRVDAGHRPAPSAPHFASSHQMAADSSMED